MNERAPLSERITLRPDEAAKLLGVSLRTLRYWIRQGRLPICQPTGPRGAVLIPRQALLDWLRQQTAAISS